MAKTTVMIGGAALLLALVSGCRPTPPFTKDARPWENGSPVEAPELEALLKPTEATKWTGLRRGTDGRYYYLAELDKEPKSDFIELQHRAYHARGVLTRAIGESPHSVPRTLGYEHLIFRRGRSRPWSLYSLVIDDSNSEWISEAPFYRQYPKPSHLEGRLFVFRLGQSDVRAWKELVIVPEQDAITLKELPFPRFRPAILSRVGGGKGRVFIARWYVSNRAEMNDVLEHYLRVIRLGGWPIDYNRNQPGTLIWSSHELPIKGITDISVMSAPLPFLFGKSLSFERVRELAPTLFSDFPNQVFAFQVNVGFEDATLAASYQPEDPVR